MCKALLCVCQVTETQVKVGLFSLSLFFFYRQNYLQTLLTMQYLHVH